MTGEWIRFFITAVLMLVGMLAFTAGVVGANRFGFALNRMHAAGIGDTGGLFFVILALLVAAGVHTDTLKLAGIVFFMWFTSPVSSHFLSQIEYYTNPGLYRFLHRDKMQTGSGAQEKNRT